MIDRELAVAILIEEAPHPLRGRSYIQKLTYLLQQETGDDWYTFDAGDYGPFSRRLYDAVEDLVDRGYVEEREFEDEDGRYHYHYVSGKGVDTDDEELREAARAVFEAYPTDDLTDLLDALYSDHPRMARNSVY